MTTCTTCNQTAPNKSCMDCYDEIIMINDKPTHSELVDIAVRWLTNHRRCPVVFAELVCANDLGMVPDAIGWYGKWSILVECKTSRADFLADRKKPIHIKGCAAPGQERWYLVPAGLVGLGEVPEGWFLAEVDEKRMVRVVSERPEQSISSLMWGASFDHERRLSEVPFLISACRRLTSGQKCVGGRFRADSSDK